MQARRIIFLFLFLTLFNHFHDCFAQEKEIDKDTQADIKRQISDLEKRVREMERQHAIEIQELNEKLQALSQEQEEKAEEDAIADLRKQAEADAAKEEVEEEPKQTIFQAGWLSLQDLNPEISVTGDMFYQYTCRDGVGHSDFVFRNLGLHFQAYLDPYTRFKAAVPVNEHGAELGEAYLTRFGIVHGLNGTAGKFRQQFGVVNRWHKHALDQLDFPLALRQIFGEGGLNQTGISLDYTLPPFGNCIQEVTLQVTNGENKRLFSGNFVSLPATLLHYKNYRDLSKDTYLEWGLTGLVGWNETGKGYSQHLGVRGGFVPVVGTYGTDAVPQHRMEERSIRSLQEYSGSGRLRKRYVERLGRLQLCAGQIVSTVGHRRPG